jgi:opine dehydrogenase
LVEKIAVLGCGHGGSAMAADLTSRGFKVNLYDLPEFDKNVKSTKERGGIEISGEITGFYKLERVTTDIEEAVEDVEIAMIVVRPRGHKKFFETVIPHLKSGQILLNWTGYWSSLRFYDLLKKKGADGVTLSEASILPYIARRMGTSVLLSAIKDELHIAAMPATDTKRVYDVVKELYPQCVAVSNVVETSLINPNVPGHIIPILLNSGYWELTNGDVEFDTLITPSVSRVMEAMDKERIAVGEALGINLLPQHKVLVKMYGKYGAKGETLYDTCRTLPKPQKTSRFQGKAQVASYSRGLKELFEKLILGDDLLWGFVPLSSIGDLFDVPTKSIDLMVDLANLILDSDCWNQGLTAEKLGLVDLTAKQIINYVTSGKK